jgi:hypothetical protein
MRFLTLKPKPDPCEVCAGPNPGPHTLVVISGQSARTVQHPGRQPRQHRLAAAYVDGLMRNSGTPGWS